MRQEQMISHLKRLRAELGRTELATRLGLRSSTTIDNWIKDGKVPERGGARCKVGKFLAALEGEHAHGNAG